MRCLMLLCRLAAAAGATGLLYALYNHINKPRVAPFSLPERRDTAAMRQVGGSAVRDTAAAG
jgi:hypothetical protein